VRFLSAHFALVLFAVGNSVGCSRSTEAPARLVNVGISYLDTRSVAYQCPLETVNGRGAHMVVFNLSEPLQIVAQTLEKELAAPQWKRRDSRHGTVFSRANPKSSVIVHSGRYVRRGDTEDILAERQSTVVIVTHFK
jgi:hypothetical protein